MYFLKLIFNFWLFFKLRFKNTKDTKIIEINRNFYTHYWNECLIKNFKTIWAIKTQKLTSSWLRIFDSLSLLRIRNFSLTIHNIFNIPKLQLTNLWFTQSWDLLQSEVAIPTVITPFFCFYFLLIALTFPFLLYLFL